MLRKQLFKWSRSQPATEEHAYFTLPGIAVDRTRSMSPHLYQRLRDMQERKMPNQSRKHVDILRVSQPDCVRTSSLDTAPVVHERIAGPAHWATGTTTPQRSA